MAVALEARLGDKGDDERTEAAFTETVVFDEGGVMSAPLIIGADESSLLVVIALVEGRDRGGVS